MHEDGPIRPNQMPAKMAQETQETVSSVEKDSGSKGVRVQTRRRREIKLPSRFHMQLWVSAGMLFSSFVIANKFEALRRDTTQRWECAGKL
jgi:hypothetical protein